MIDVIVTVGIYLTEEEIKREGILYTLPQLPSVGDMIIPNDTLKAKLDEKAKEWDADSNCPINFVRQIGWLDVMPVVMLSFHPHRICVDLVYKDKVRASTLQVMPKVNDQLVLADESLSRDPLYVQQIYHFRNTVIINLSDKPADQSKDDVLDVRVINTVSAHVENVVDVNLYSSNEVLDVNIDGQANVIDVRTRREDY